jgi:hypothetical protein
VQRRREVREGEEIVELLQLRRRVHGLLAAAGRRLTGRGRPGFGGLGRGIRRIGLRLGLLRPEHGGAGDDVEQPPHVRDGELLRVVLCARRRGGGGSVTDCSHFAPRVLEESGICGLVPSTMVRWQGLRAAISTVSLSWPPRTCIWVRWAVSDARITRRVFEPLGNGSPGAFFITSWDREKLVRWQVSTWTARSFRMSRILSVDMPCTQTDGQPGNRRSVEN